MNHRNLLKKYMDVVALTAGASIFMESVEDAACNSLPHLPEFSKAEIAELQEIAEEVQGVETYAMSSE